MNKPSHYVVLHRVDKSEHYPKIRKYRVNICSNLFIPVEVFNIALSVLRKYQSKYPHDYVYIDRVCAF